MPSAFELAVLASLNKGNLRTAFHSYLTASEYLKTNGLAEFVLRKGKLSKKKIEAFGKLVASGALYAGEKAEEYVKLTQRLSRDLRLYKDERLDEVKRAISAVTGRPCKYETARDHLKKAWEQKPSRYTPPDLLTRIKARINPWDGWCDAQTVVRLDQGKKIYYLWIPGELLNATLHLVGQQRKLKKQ